MIAVTNLKLFHLLYNKGVLFLNRPPKIVSTILLVINTLTGVNIKKIEQAAINTYMLKLYPDKENLSMSRLVMSPVSTIVVSIYLI